MKTAWGPSLSAFADNSEPETHVRPMDDLTPQQALTRSRFHFVADVILVLAALFACSLLAYRQFVEKASGTDRAPVSRRAERLADGVWSALRHEARWVTPNHTGVEVVVFVDVECPFCRRFDESLGRAVTTLGDSIVVGNVHYPLNQHRFAMIGAKALECTSSLAAYGSLLAALFRDQDSLGIKSWGRFAMDAAESDTSAFVRCVMREGIPPAVRAGRQIGDAIGVKGTPTVIVAGWKLAQAPTLEQLTAIVRAVSRGRSVDDAIRETATNEKER